MQLRIPTLAFALLLAGCGGNATEPSSKSAALRVGHTYVNGNCALDSENKLTGLCEGRGKAGCITHEPDPDSPSCTAGLVVKETRVPACSTSACSEVVSRAHVCFFVNRDDR
jgi:hypothetical protein